MFRIRRIYDDIVPANRSSIGQVQAILKARFSAVSQEEIERIGEKLRNPFKQRFRAILFVAENLRRQVLGFAMILHEPEIGFCYLDWIATAKGRAGGGIGGALYERVRAEAAALRVKGLFFECLPDDLDKCPDPDLLKENRARLRFYERYGARPIIHTAYEAPVKPGDTCMPHLVVDLLDSIEPIRRPFLKKVVRAILERKYGSSCPPQYVHKVVVSILDDPVRLRPFRYHQSETVRPAVVPPILEPIPLVVNDKHAIHHVHERGYVESPVRVRNILKKLEPGGLFTRIPVRHFPDRHLTAVHDPDFVSFLREASKELSENRALYPYVFPIRNKTKPPKEPSVLSGYYCIDTFTPIHRNAFPAARRAVDCALTAAQEILEGRRAAYALVRPPGHHAERRAFGGFCYFNNTAAAAQYLSPYGRTAILDIDYHHGNGQQDIFYTRSDVLTVSIHGHPEFAYPYFSGFEEEIGEADGEGFNLNLPLPESVDGPKYRKALSKALDRIAEFNPAFLVVALGFDTARGDPTGTWDLTASDFEANGKEIGALGMPVLVIQEGGYRTANIGTNAARFFSGLAAGIRTWADSRHAFSHRPNGISFRTEVLPQDPERIRKLVTITGFFSDEEVKVAGELAEEHLKTGTASGYLFLFAEQFGRMVGYACYGPVPMTASSFDLYWIAVHPDLKRRGVGRRLLLECEKRIREAGGDRIYVETSSRAIYAPTRAFYEDMGYRQEAFLTDFYRPGDSKVVFLKRLEKALQQG